MAWITRTNAARLLRFDLRTGGMREGVDLSVFGDGQGAPDLKRMAGAELTAAVIPTSGAPSDLLALARTPRPR